MSKKYYHTKESVDEYIKAAEGFNGKHQIEKFKNYITPKSSILEIGSGPGTDWELLNNLYNTTGSDLSDEFLQRLYKKYPTGEFLKLDAANLNTSIKFDGIYSNKVLHHLQTEELQTSIKTQSQILNPEGIICHSFWKGEGSEIFKGLFVNYHSNKDLNKYFSIYFDILLIENYKEFDDDDSIFLIAKKK